MVWLTLGCIALTIVYAYPLSVHPGDHVMSLGTDANLYIWTLAWDVHALVHRPLSIFESNIFYPLHHTLAYSENLIGSALFAAPVLWLTGNPALAMNVAALVTAPLCALGAYVLARAVGVSVAGATLAAMIYGFSPPRFFRLDQLHLTNVQWIPFSVAFAHRYLDRRQPRDLRLAIAFFTLQALTSGHGAVFLAIVLAALIVYHMVLGEPAAPIERLRDAGIVGALLLAPAILVVLPYRVVQVEMGLRRTLENWHVSWTSFLASPSHVQQYLVARFIPFARVYETATAYLFPGYIPLMLGAVGIVWRVERGIAWRRAALALNVVVVLALAVAVYATATNDARVRIGTIVVLSARQAWRAWLWVAVALAMRIAIASRVPLLSRPRFPRGDAATFYTLMFVLSVWLSMGPPFGAWQFIYWLPGLNFIRAPSRFMILGILALAVVAAHGFDRLTARLSARQRSAAAASVAAIMAIEFAGMPLDIAAQSVRLPAVDRWLATRPPPFAVAEVPVADSKNVTVREERQSIYMLHSMAHWQKTIHGYSGLLPNFSDNLYWQLTTFPDATSIHALSEIGVTYVVVHEDLYAPGEWPDVERRLARFPELTLEHTETGGRVYSLPNTRFNLSSGRPVEGGMRTLAAAAIVLQTAGAGAQTADIHGTWTAELRNNKVFLQVQAPQPDDWNRNNDWRGGWNMGQSLPVDELSGLPGNDERFTAASVKFELRREGGTLGFEGSFRDGRGAGLFTFAPRREYIAEMRRLGYNDDIPLWRQFQLTVHDVGPRYIAALKAEGYDKLSLDQIQRSKNHGVTIDYIKAMKAEGFKAATLEELVRTRDHGVTPTYIQDMRKAGFGNVAIEDLVRSRDHGVSPEFVQEIRRLGLTASTIDQFVRLRDHGVTAQFVNELKSAGYDKLATEDLVRVRDHGVNAAFIRELGAQGFKNLPIDDVVRAKDHGVSADYLADMKSLLKDLSLTQVVRMRDHGVTPGFINHARARGFTTTDPEELVRLKDRGLWKN